MIKAIVQFTILLSFLSVKSYSFTPTRCTLSRIVAVDDKHSMIPTKSPRANRISTVLSGAKNQIPESPDSPPSKSNKKPLGKQLRRSFVISTSLALLTNIALATAAPPGFQRIPTQFIAAISDPQASSGSNAMDWGVWTVDPGPRGVFLKDYQSQLSNRKNVAPAGWTYDPKDWWVEEHGLIMEAPKFPLNKGRYLVTGGRLTTTVLDVQQDGKWTLEKGSLYDVTHLPCRSARYTPKDGAGNGSPLTANQKDFPVEPGAEMPKVEGCDNVDYAVLFVIGKEA